MIDALAPGAGVGAAGVGAEGGAAAVPEGADAEGELLAAEITGGGGRAGGCGLVPTMVLGAGVGVDEAAGLLPPAGVV